MVIECLIQPTRHAIPYQYVVKSSLGYCNRPFQNVINIGHRKTEDVLKVLCFLVPTLETCPVAGAKVLTFRSS